MGTEPIRFPVYAPVCRFLVTTRGNRIPGPYFHGSSADCATSPVPPGVCFVRIGPGSSRALHGRSAQLVLALVTAHLALAQAPAFDVASLKLRQPVLATEGSNRESVEATTGSLTMRNVNLLSCIRWAYGVKEYQVAGPAALTAEKYDILAKAGALAPPEQMRPMLAALLAERLQLRVHRESKERAVYLLRVVKAVRAAKAVRVLRHAEPGGNSGMFRRDGSFIFRSRSMQQFADDLAGLARVDRPVLDQTGIPGIFDFSLKFGETGEEMKRVLNESEGASLFTLLQEQLGLKVESAKAPIDMVVVDHVEKVPVEN